MKRLWGGPLVVLSLLLGGVNGQEPEMRPAPQERAASPDSPRPRRQRTSVEQAMPPEAGKSVSIQLLLLEIAKEGKQSPKLDLSNAATLDTQVRTLEEAGEVSVIYRVRMSSLEHLPCSLQVGGMRPMAVGRTMFGGRREGGPAGGNISYQMTDLGTRFQCTPRVEEDGAVLVELQVSSSRLVPMPKSDGDSSDPSAQQRIASLETQATVRIPKDQATIVSASQSAGSEESQEFLILISAQVESSHSAK